MIRSSVCVLLFLLPALAAAAATEMDQAVSSRVDAILDVATGGDFERAAQQADELFDAVTGWAETTDEAAFRRAAFARRLVHQLDGVAPPDGAALPAYLRGREKLAASLAFLIGPSDEPEKVYALLDRLRAVHGDKLEDFAMLTAAICVVHDEPLARRVNENQTRADDAAALFDYFVRHEKRMLFGLRSVPAELLIYAVDSTAPIAEMEWALSKYAGDQRVGRQFFRIDYDSRHYRSGAVKKVTRAGFTLPNILEHGGVCADQAYFAVAVGKSIGVPTAYTVGRGSDVGHAWVGYLRASGKQGAWDFSEGRYEVYQGVRGVIEDPQTRRNVDDSTVALLAELIGTSIFDRHAAAAMTDAAVRLAWIEREGEPFDPSHPVSQESASPDARPRAPDPEVQLALIEAGLRRCPGYARGWEQIGRMARDGRLTFEQKKRWADLVMKLCGDRYPDFAVATLHPMISTVEDVERQNRIWESAFKRFSRRHDLAAEIRMAQGEAWATAGDPTRAGRCYQDVIQRYANAGPFVLDALARTEQALVDSGRGERVPELYRRTWEQIRQPKGMAPAFMTQSNWFKVGVLYAGLLQNAGREGDAERVASRIREVTGVALAGER